MALSPINEPARIGNLEEVRRRIQQEPQLVQSRDECGCTPLFWALEGGQVEVAAWLLDQGADMNDTGDLMELTALYRACERGRLPMVEMLLG